MKTEIRAIVAILVVAAFAFGSVSGVAHSWYSDEEKATVTVETGIIGIYGQITNSTGGSSHSHVSDRELFVEFTKGYSSTTLSANYSVTDCTTVTEVKYRMYYVVEVLFGDGSSVNILINNSKGSEISQLTIDDSNQTKYVYGYVYGNDNSGYNISPRGEYGIKISCTPSSTNVKVSFSIIVEAYSSGHNFTTPNHIGYNGKIVFTGLNKSSELTFKGTIPSMDNDLWQGYIDADITFSAGAISSDSSATSDTTVDPAVKNMSSDLTECIIRFVGINLTDNGKVIVSLASKISKFDIIEIKQGGSILYNGGP